MTAHPKTSKLPLPISSPPASIRPAPPSNPNFLSSNAMAPSSLKRTLSVCLPKPVVLHSASSQLNRSCIFQNRESASRKLFSNQAIVHILTPNSPQPQVIRKLNFRRERIQRRRRTERKTTEKLYRERPRCFPALLRRILIGMETKKFILIKKLKLEY